MTDILDLIDGAIEHRCACGCGAGLDQDGPSAWFASQGCQQQWNEAHATDPYDVYRRPDAHELIAMESVATAGERPSGILAMAGNLPEGVAPEALLGQLINWSAVPAVVEHNGARWTYTGAQLPASAETELPPDDDRVLIRIRQSAHVREDGTLILGELRMSTAPEWLARLYPDVEEWERCGAMWRGRGPGMFARDVWLYVLRDGDAWAGTQVTGEFAATAVDAERFVADELRGEIERRRAGG